MPLIIPATHSIRLALKPSRKDLIIGIPPATAASNATITPLALAAAKISVPCTANKALLAVTMCLPLAIAANTNSLDKVSPPINSTITSISGWLIKVLGSATTGTVLPTISWAAATLRLHTITTSMPRPVRRIISSWLRFKTLNTPAPTVPRPKIPIFKAFITSLFLSTLNTSQLKILPMK